MGPCFRELSMCPAGIYFGRLCPKVPMQGLLQCQIYYILHVCVNPYLGIAFTTLCDKTTAGNYTPSPKFAIWGFGFTHDSTHRRK